MNELQVKTIKLEPATIVFNHKEIEKELDATLERYANLVFTEENTTDLRNTIAEIRKGQNALNRYRIDTKKELNKPADEFDTTVKGLDEKFKSVLNPLLEQQSEFEETRKAEKRKAVQEIIDQVIEEFELDHERADEIQIIDSYLTKSKSIKSITDELTAQATNLKLQQDKEKADKSVIETTVKLANSENDLSLSAEAYIRLLDFQDVERVKDQIENDSKKEVEARELAVKRELEKIERKKEQERLAEEKQKLQEAIEERAAEREVEQPSLEPEEKVGFEQVPLSSAPSSISDDSPSANPFGRGAVFESAVNPFAEKIRTFEVTYKIKATNDELQELVTFMTDKGIKFEVVEI